MNRALACGGDRAPRAGRTRSAVLMPLVAACFDAGTARRGRPEDVVGDEYGRDRAAGLRRAADRRATSPSRARRAARALEHDGGHQPDRARAGAGARVGGRARGREALVLGQQLHVRGVRHVDPRRDSRSRRSACRRSPSRRRSPIASSLPAVVAGVAPEETWPRRSGRAAVAVLLWSTTVASATVERPEYSSAATPTSALAVGVTVIVGLVPPPAVIGALHTLISVLSEALKCSSSV